jgi:hypothetical protein
MRDSPSDITNSMSSIDREIKIDLQSLVIPGHTIVIQMPKLDYPYKKDDDIDTTVYKEYIIDGEISGTPIQVMNTLYSRSRTTLNSNLLKKKIEGKHTLLLGKNIIIVNAMPALLFTEVYNTDAERIQRRVVMSDTAFLTATPTLKYILTKIIPRVLYNNNEIKLIHLPSCVVSSVDIRRRTSMDTIQQTILDNFDKL